ncbi:elongation factor G [Clostridia bacterium]|nr:elongation factor G [Clostridia bacterium]
MTIKNIALAGHNGEGKTALAEALLFKAGAVDRLGTATAGTTVMDFDAEETKRVFSINTSVATFDLKNDDVRVNLIDTPGMFDFAGGMYEGITAANTVIIPVSGKSGVKVGTKKAYKLAAKLGKSKLIVITKIDDPNANFYNTLTALKTEFGASICPVIVPVIKNSEIDSFINLIEQKAYKYDDKGNAKEIDMPTDLQDKDYRLDGLVGAISEAVAETDEALMEKFFMGEPFTQKEIIDGIHNGMNKGIITPVVLASSTTLAGIDMLLKEFVLLFPNQKESGNPLASAGVGDSGEEPKYEKEIAVDADGDLALYVFKTVADPFGDKVYAKVMRGTLTPDTEVKNANGDSQKIGKFYSIFGKKTTEISKAIAGEIVSLAKINARAGETLCNGEYIQFPSVKGPTPCFSLAVRSKSQGDEGKISSGISRILAEDLTLTYGRDNTTKEFILSGLGDQHLEVAMSKLKTKFGAEVETSKPKISYKETITKKVSERGRHKKQSGGAGQFGDVVIEFEPTVGDELVFEEKVFGGAVPRNYFPAVEKGLQDCVQKGVLAGCPVVGLKAILTDGSYHPVDSNELSFKLAATLAYKAAMPKAGPKLLEPIFSFAITIPDENTGDIMGELNKRRGRVLGIDPVEKGISAVNAEAPMMEMQDFSLYLRQVTRGMGDYVFEFLRYEQLPDMLVTNVVANIKTEE